MKRRKRSTAIQPYTNMIISIQPYINEANTAFTNIEPSIYKSTLILRFIAERIRYDWSHTEGIVPYENPVYNTGSIVYDWAREGAAEVITLWLETPSISPERLCDSLITMSETAIRSNTVELLELIKQLLPAIYHWSGVNNGR